MKNKDWSEEFDEKFPDVLKHEMQEIDPRGVFTSTGQMIDISSEIKSFIHSQRQAVIEEIRKQLENEDPSTGISSIPESDQYANGWNDCRRKAYEMKQVDHTNRLALLNKIEKEV